MLAVSFGYGYGLVCFANAALDHGPAQAKQVVVQSQSTRRGVATVVVSPKVSPDERHSLMVPRLLHDKLPPNSSAFLVVKPGALEIPWVVDVAPAP
jgi:hypothetical protein